MMDEEQIARLERRIPELAGAAFAEAQRRTLAAGHSVLVSDNGIIYEVLPGGTRRLVKRIVPPTPGEPGQKITIR
jgi:hypothetical protein